MLESVSFCLVSLCGAGTLPLQEAVLPVLRVAIVLGGSAVGAGLWIASRLARPRVGSPAEQAQATCQLHDWLQLEDGGFVCLQCNYRAGASFASAREERV
jgi:hypothetical protein